MGPEAEEGHPSEAVEVFLLLGHPGNLHPFNIYYDCWFKLLSLIFNAVRTFLLIDLGE